MEVAKYGTTETFGTLRESNRGIKEENVYDAIVGSRGIRPN
jgi:hypothetical protein